MAKTGNAPCANIVGMQQSPYPCHPEQQKESPAGFPTGLSDTEFFDPFIVATALTPDELLLVLAFAAIDPQDRICGAEAHGRGYQRDARNGQRHYPPNQFNRSRQPCDQQHHPKHDANCAVHSADIAFHDDLLMMIGKGFHIYATSLANATIRYPLQVQVQPEI